MSGGSAYSITALASPANAASGAYCDAVVTRGYGAGMLAPPPASMLVMNGTTAYPVPYVGAGVTQFAAGVYDIGYGLGWGIGLRDLNTTFVRAVSSPYRTKRQNRLQ